MSVLAMGEPTLSLVFPCNHACGLSFLNIAFCFRPQVIPEIFIDRNRVAGRHPFQQKCFQPRVCLPLLRFLQQAADVFADVAIAFVRDLRIDETAGSGVD
jgi:hypothetical protein